MTTFHPHDPLLLGFNYPSRVEADVHDLEIEGRVPRELNGSFMRQTADPQFAPLGPTIVVEPDGLVQSFTFDDGRVHFRSRYVQTPRWKAERAAGRALFGRYRNPYTDDPSVRGIDRTTANTSLFWHHGRLLAMKEDGLPYELDRETLATVGRYDFGGKVRSHSLSAHPKIDPRTGEMLLYSGQARGETTRDVCFYVADAEGQITHETWFEAPYGSILHDFAATERYAVFPVMPATTDLDRLKAGGPIYQWQPERGTAIGVLPRHGAGSEVRWFRTDACYVFHVLNAYDEGSLIHVDVMESPVFPGWFPTPEQVQGVMAALQAGQRPDDGYHPKLVRWTIDLAGRTEEIRRTVLHDWDGEMPRLDERRALQSYRYGLYGVDDPRYPLAHAFTEAGVNHNSVGWWDHQRQSLTTWYTGPHAHIGEPIFVPRADDAPEGDGFVLGVVAHHDTRQSDVVVLDTQDLAAGPVATIRMPFRLKNGVHGAWVPA